MNDTLRAALFGTSLAKKIIRNNPEGSLIFTSQNYGDQTLALSFAKEYKIANNLNKVIYLTSNPKNALMHYFRDQVDEICEISKGELNVLLKFYKSDIGQIFREKESRLLCTFCTAYVRNDLIRNSKNLDFIRVEKAIYRIPENSRPCGIGKHLIDYSIADRYKDQIEENNTVIINPYANSCRGVPVELFSKIARKLSKAGMCVVSSTYGNQKPVDSSNGLQFDMYEAVPLFEKCGFIVGVRSGFLDLAAQGSAVIASIDSDDYLYSDFYRIEAWKRDGYLRSFRYKPDREEQLVSSIVEYILGARNCKKER